MAKLIQCLRFKNKIKLKKKKKKVKSLSRVRPSATPWTAAFQAPPSMGFSMEEYWSGLPLPSPLIIHAVAKTKFCLYSLCRKYYRDFSGGPVVKTPCFQCRGCGFEPCFRELRGFLGGSAGKESTCNGGDLGLIPGLGRSPGEGNGTPLQYSCLENPMDGEAW